MFMTFSCDEEPLPVGLRQDGLRLWSNVQMSLNVYWFYVVFSVKHSEELEVSRAALIIHVDQLLEFGQRDDTEITEVGLMSPSHLNDKGGWAFEPLKEIWGEFELNEEHEQLSDIFVLKNGGRYTYSRSSTNETELLERKLIFSVPEGKPVMA